MQNFLQKHGFKILIGILCILILIVVTNNKNVSINIIDTKESFNQLLEKNDIKIIDVRTKSEYNEGHIPKAINVEYSELKNKIKYDKKAEIIVYSQNDSRSHLAAKILKNMGYKKIYEGNMEKYEGKLVTN